MRLKSLLTESINDKGIFKALFVAGYPGSGKTTLIRKVHDGSYPVMMVNSDIWTEYYLRFDRTAWSDIGPLVRQHSLSNVYFHLNSLLPIYVDSTGSSPVLFKQRVDILKALGYDMKMILIDVELETSKERAKRRGEMGGRKVDENYIEMAHNQINKDRGMYRSYIPDFKTVKNNEGDMTPAILNKISNEVFSFFSSPIKNDQGKKIVDFMRKKGYKYYQDIPDNEKIEQGFMLLDKSNLNWY